MDDVFSTRSLSPLYLRSISSLPTPHPLLTLTTPRQLLPYPLVAPSRHVIVAYPLMYILLPTNTPNNDNNFICRVVNLARLLAHLLCTFHLPLAVLKPIDIGANLNANMILFLATFFMSLFSAKVSEDTFQTILDRVATTKDFMTVRDGILFFLQTHLKQIPRGLEVIHPSTHSLTRSLIHVHIR